MSEPGSCTAGTERNLVSQIFPSTLIQPTKAFKFIVPSPYVTNILVPTSTLRMASYTDRQADVLSTRHDSRFARSESISSSLPIITSWFPGATPSGQSSSWNWYRLPDS